MDAHCDTNTMMLSLRLNKSPKVRWCCCVSSAPSNRDDAFVIPHGMHCVSLDDCSTSPFPWREGYFLPALLDSLSRFPICFGLSVDENVRYDFPWWILNVEEKGRVRKKIERQKKYTRFVHCTRFVRALCTRNAHTSPHRLCIHWYYAHECTLADIAD